MSTDTKTISLGQDSELVKLIKAGERHVILDTGESTYELYVEESVPTPEQAALSQAGIRGAAGAWQGLVDAERFKAYVARRRRMSNRPSVRL